MILDGMQVALFDGLSAEETALFFDLAERRLFGAGEIIIAEGDEGNALYIVAKGTVQVEKATLDQQQEVLTSLGMGECFGELALVDRRPRSATVRAVGATEVFELSQEALSAFFVSHSDLHRRVLENLVKITAQHIRRMDENLIQSIYDSIIWLDAQCRVRSAQRMTDRRAFFGDAAQILGQDVFACLPQLGEGVRQTLLQVMASGKTTTLSLEFVGERKAIAYFEVTLAPQGDGAALGIRDVTDSKSLESRLIQAEKLAMAGQMSAEIGHELKNYLTVIMGHTELLMINPVLQGEERILRSLNAISEQLTRMTQFSAGLMDLGMLRSKTEPVALNVLVRKLVQFIQGQSRFRRIEFALNLADDLPRLQMDPGQIQQVLINLYANAADAMEKGQIETVTQLDDENKHVILTVTDHGPGMPEAVRSQIFDSGFTTKETGHGFGLPICLRIIENHGGEIAVDSTAGEGTTFTLTFPAPRL